MLALQVYIQLEIYVPITIVTKNEQTNLGSQFDWTLKIDLYWRIRQQYYNPVCLSQMARRSHRSRKRRAFSTISNAPTTWISDRLICILHRHYVDNMQNRKNKQRQICFTDKTVRFSNFLSFFWHLWCSNRQIILSQQSIFR